MNFLTNDQIRKLNDEFGQVGMERDAEIRLNSTTAAQHEPGSAEWIYQQVMLLRHDVRHQNSSYQRQLDKLGRFLERKPWLVVPTDAPYGDALTFMMVELGYSEGSAQSVLRELEIPFTSSKSNMAMALADRVQEMRAEGMTQQQIAETVGVSQPRVNQIISETDNLSEKLITQEQRAQLNGVGVVTQRKIDQLQERAPDLHLKYVQGEMSVSAAYNAMIEREQGEHVTKEKSLVAAFNAAMKLDIDQRARLMERLLDIAIEDGHADQIMHLVIGRLKGTQGASQPPQSAPEAPQEDPWDNDASNPLHEDFSEGAPLHEEEVIYHYGLPYPKEERPLEEMQIFAEQCARCEEWPDRKQWVTDMCRNWSNNSDIADALINAGLCGRDGQPLNRKAIQVMLSRTRRALAEQYEGCDQ